MILEQLTYNSFGYRSTDLSRKSAKKIIAICDICGKLRVLKKRDYRKLCVGCCKIGVNNPFYGRKHTKKAKNKIGVANSNNVGYWLGKHRSNETKEKISRNKKGKKPNLSREQKLNKIKKSLGSNNGNWKGGITKLQKNVRSLSLYNNWRKKVFKIDEYKCIMCGNKSNLVSHHIMKFSDILNNYIIETTEDAINCDKLWDVRNGITLCKKCHSYIHKINGI